MSRIKCMEAEEKIKMKTYLEVEASAIILVHFQVLHIPGILLRFGMQSFQVDTQIMNEMRRSRSA
jgi:hypothetical protein